jgi:hypothetical protein
VVDTFSVQRTSTDNEGLYVTVSGADANAIVETFYQEDSGALYGFRKRYDGSTNLYQEFIHDNSATGTEVYRVNRSTKNTSILNGNVGIGTTSPAQKLDVVGNIATSGSIELGDASDTTITRVSAGRIAVEGVNVVTTSSADILTSKTLTSPVINTPTGIVKGDVGLGNVDNTADTAKPVSTAQQTELDLKLNTEDLDAILEGAEVRSAGRLTTARTIGGVSFNGTANINLPGVNAAGTQNTSGNAATATKLTSARTIGGVSFDGSANIPQRQVTHHSATFTFAVNTKQYIGLLDSDSESTAASNINLPFLAPFSGKLLKIFVRSGNNLTGGNLTLRLEKNALDVNAGGTPTVVTTNPNAQLGPSNSTMKTYEWITGTHSNTITAGDMIFISIASDTVFTGVKIFFTCLWEWDH